MIAKCHLCRRTRTGSLMHFPSDDKSRFVCKACRAEAEGAAAADQAAAAVAETYECPEEPIPQTPKENSHAP